MLPLKFLHTAAWAEKLSLMAVSKFTLKEPARGGVQDSFGDGELEFQTAAWSKAVLLMEFAKELIFGMTPSWAALFLENHKRSQRTEANIWNKWESCFGIPKERWGLIMPLIQSERLKKDHAREFRGQKEDLQATRAKMQLKKRWERLSVSVLQRGHRESECDRWRMEFNLVFVGSISQAIFQRKRISLAFSLSFHKEFQKFGSKGEMEEEVLWLLISL
jgi:hypothetical protein